MKNSIFIILTISVFFIISCQKSEPTNSSPGYTIYMAGNYDNKVVYWKNNSITIVTPNEIAFATSIAVVGNDVYMGGYIMNGNDVYAAYWKNSKEFMLDSSGSSFVYGIAVDGNDVYCVGNIQGPSNTVRATCWKNGVPTYLNTETNGTAYTVSASNSVVYIGGNVSTTTEDSAVIWKNGTMYTYAYSGYINGISWSSTDTLIAGSFGNVVGQWANNNFSKLSDFGQATSATISGNDSYVGGGSFDQVSSRPHACIWKNNTLTILDNAYESSLVNGISLAGTDLYAVGNFYENGKYIAVYWLNGNLKKLQTDGNISSICITKNQ